MARSLPSSRLHGPCKKKRRARRIRSALGDRLRTSGWICPPIEILERRCLLAAGGIDTSYGSNGVATAAFPSYTVVANTSIIEPDGKLLVTGGIQTNQHPLPFGMAVARFNTNGTLDSSFGSAGTVIVSQTGTALHIAIAPDGGILLSGLDSAGNGNIVARLTDAGAIDATFGSGGTVTVPGLDGAAIASLSDGKIIAIGDEPGKYDIARLDANGSLDATFGTAGVSIDAMPQGSAGTFYGVADAVIRSDGAIVTSALVNRSGTAGFELARFNTDGSLDASFGGGGTVETPLQTPIDAAETLGIESDGKIILAGSTPLPPAGGNGDFALVRYNTNGTRDSSYGSNGEAVTSLLGWVTKAMVEPDGKAVLACTVANSGNALVRFNADGSLDGSFGTQGVAMTSYDNIISSVVEQADGEYIFTTAQTDTMLGERFVGEPPPTTSGIGDVNVPENSLATVVPLPSDFQGGSVPSSQLTYSIAADSNPALFSSITIDAQTGKLTLSYAANQSGTAQLTVRALDPDGATVEAGFQVTLTANQPLPPGSLDTTYGNAGVVTTSFSSGTAYVYALARQSDGKLVAAGVVQGQGYAVARYNTDGSLDTSFGSGGTVTIASAGFARQVAIEPDGKIVIVGDRNVGGADTLVVRLTSDGALDSSFGTNGQDILNLGSGGGLAITSTGTIFVGGDLGGTINVGRLNADGSLDTAFGTNGIASLPVPSFTSDSISDLALDSDGKIVVGGTGETGGGSDVFSVVRFNSDGTPDTSFGTGGLVQTTFRGLDIANAMAVQPDDKIVLAGQSYSSGSGPSYSLAMARYNTDGSLDTTFGSGGKVLDALGSEVSAIFDLFVEPNGKLVAAGQSEGYAALFRFNSDGTLDSMFGNGGVALSLQNTTGVDVGEGHAVIEQSDGKYVMAADRFTLERFLGEIDEPLTATGTTILVSEGASFSGTAATFTDADPTGTTSDYSATVDWGDGTAPTIVTGSQMSDAGGIFTLPASHVYAEEGTYTVTVTITDIGGATATAGSTAIVQDASLGATASALSATEGSTFSGAVATFTDSNQAGSSADYAATIDWGDKSSMTTVSGSQISETSGIFSVPGSHVYADEGAYTLTVTISDVGGATATASNVATVDDATLGATPSAVAATQLSTFTGTVATFSDANSRATSADYTAVIDWGDNTSPTTVSGSQMTEAGGTFSVPGSHVYAQQGDYTLTVTISDPGGATATIKPVAIVSDASLNAIASAVSATEGSTFSGPGRYVHRR